MAGSKKRVIKSFEALNEDLKDLMRHQYPNGYQGSITRIVNAKKEPIFVFPLETDEAIYLIKLPATKNSAGGYDVEPAEKEEFKPPKAERGQPAGEDDFDNTDDNFDSEREEEESEDKDTDEEEGNKRGREASYDPDFDG